MSQTIPGLALTSLAVYNTRLGAAAPGSDTNAFV